jgi:hypothetical protein
MVAARCRPVATHAPVGAVPTALTFFFADGGSAAEVKDLTDARLMAVMPPRPVAFYFFPHSYCI